MSRKSRGGGGGARTAEHREGGAARGRVASFLLRDASQPRGLVLLERCREARQQALAECAVKLPRCPGRASAILNLRDARATTSLLGTRHAAAGKGECFHSSRGLPGAGGRTRRAGGARGRGRPGGGVAGSPTVAARGCFLIYGRPHKRGVPCRGRGRGRAVGADVQTSGRQVARAGWPWGGDSAPRRPGHRT